MLNRYQFAIYVAVAAVIFGTVASTSIAASPSVTDALSLQPTQNGVNIASPSKDVIPKCKLKVEKDGKAIGWTLTDPQGTILRRFIDTNGDKVVDRWCYYNQGVEVYRDIDSDYNNRADQYRWFSMEGTRWGIDKNEDGTVDYWKTISPEEVTAEAVAALAEGDWARFRSLALTPGELKSLGLSKEKAKQIAKQLATLDVDFKKVAQTQNQLNKQSEWIQFNGYRPGVIPAGTQGSQKDVEAYENVSAVISTNGKSGEVRIGTLVRVGDGWRLFMAPQLVSENSPELLAGTFFSGSNLPGPQTVGANTPMPQASQDQKLLDSLQAIDTKLQKVTSVKEAAKLNAQRVDILEKLANAADSQTTRDMWIRQIADVVGAAVQSGQYPDGTERLGELYDKLKKNKADYDLAAYIRFRQLTANYYEKLNAPNANYQDIQKEWIDNLEEFANEFSKSPESAEAILQLAMNLEFAGEDDKAVKWYGEVAKNFPNTSAATKAAGAKTRLTSVGKPLDFQGKTTSGNVVDLKKYRGKTVLLQFWATWSEPATTAIPVLKDLLDKYGTKLSVIGVNLDSDPKAVSAFLKENRIPWPQVYETGGLDSRPANSLGIMTVPTMILIGPDGKVINRNIDVAELNGELKRIIR
ncbi:MAG: thioredoxin-like domain-containing protein [Planctomycetia bacterium]|jgi:thiol-disulfide isomerase/thioredoxin